MISIDTDNRMKQITNDLKRDVKELLGESANLVTGFFRRGVCTVRAVADKWKAFAHDITDAVDTLMKPPFVEDGPEAPATVLDPEAQPIVTVAESIVAELPIGRQMPLSEANELVRALDEQYQTNEWTAQPVKLRIDYTLNGQTDRYWLPLQIGGGGSLVEQMDKLLHGYRNDPAKIEQLFENVSPEFRDEIRTALLPVVHDNINFLSDRVLVFFQRHCEVADLENKLYQYADTLPESARQRFREFTAIVSADLRQSANSGLSGRSAPQQERPQTTQEEKPRRSVRVQLRQLKGAGVQRHRPKIHDTSAR